LDLAQPPCLLIIRLVNV